MLIFLQKGTERIYSQSADDLPVVGLHRAGQARDPGHPAPGALFPPSGGWDPSWRGTVAPLAPAHSETILDPVPEVLTLDRVPEVHTLDHVPEVHTLDRVPEVHTLDRVPEVH
jgi:hypothetical protein